MRKKLLRRLRKKLLYKCKKLWKSKFQFSERKLFKNILKNPLHKHHLMKKKVTFSPKKLIYSKLKTLNPEKIISMKRITSLWIFQKNKLIIDRAMMHPLLIKDIKNKIEINIGKSMNIIDWFFIWWRRKNQ